MSAPFSRADFPSFLAPMQDITDAGFMSIIASYGPPDFFAAQYFRIHCQYCFDRHILEAIFSRPGGKKVVAQFIGEDEGYIRDACLALSETGNIDMLDLNIGCPAPKIYKKNVGGGLLRERGKIASILKVMRQNWQGCLSAKMRLGFDSADGFLDTFKTVIDSGVDYITVHGRTVRQLYRGGADIQAIADAAEISPVPVVANGDISTAEKAMEIFKNTKCSGVMIGRHAVRNPWIFRQINQLKAGEKVFEPTLADVRGYVDKLYGNIKSLNSNIRHKDSRLKKFLNFVAVGVDPEGRFLGGMRRAQGIDQLLKVCDAHLLGSNADKKFNCGGYKTLVARPNHED